MSGAPTSPEGAGSGSAAAALRSILIVDDESRIRENLATLLAGSQYRIETAPDAPAAIAALTERPFDLVITDLMMEGGDGYSLLEWVRSHMPRTLVTVITGYASMESTIRAMQIGAFDYLVKPFDIELLSISVDRAMRRIEADRAAERAQEEVRTWSTHLAAVNRIGRRAAAILSEPELLRFAARAVHEEFRYYHVYFAMLDEPCGRLVIQAQAGAFEGKMPEGYVYEAGTGITGKAIATGKPLVVSDVREHPDYIPLVPETRSQVALPLVVEGRAIGALSVESAVAGSFGPRDQALLETLGDMVASAIQNARLFHQVKGTKDYLEALITSSADAIVTTDTRGAITFFSPGAESIYGYGASEVVGRGVASYYEGGEAEAKKVMNLLLQYERLKNYETVLIGRDGRRVYASISASLLKDRTGEIIGTLGVSKDISQRVEMERKLKELTITDSLTGLYNQRYFYRKVHAEMERARRQKRSLALLLFDLDHFKEYNDSHGHLEGDRVLREVGRLLRDSIRNLVDSAFRYGGDEFVVLLPELEGNQALGVVRRIKTAIESGLNPPVSLSMGLVEFRPVFGAEEFIRIADEAMYESKRRRDGSIVTR